MRDSGISVSEYAGNNDEKRTIRHSLSKEDFSNETSFYVDTILNAIERELESIVIEATRQADLFWAVALMAREDSKEDKDKMGWKNLCRIGTRVVFKNGTFSAEWFRNRYVSKGEGQRKQVYSTYLRKGAGYSYSAALFKAEPAWVQELVAVTEKEYARLRERAAMLTKQRTAVKVYDRFCKR